jgi:DNA processing protein
MMPDERLVDLCSVPGMTQARIRNLLARFEVAEKVFGAAASELTLVRGVSEDLARSIREYRRSSETASRLKQARELGCRAITRQDPDYPANLATIDRAPPVLFVRGTLKSGDALALAIIGTRRATPYGMMVAQRFARGLAEQGVTVVSGLARGIDTAAHIGALAGRGRTIAVLGCGVDVYYPPENRRLYDQIAESGAVVSEFNFGTGPEAFHFPVRNRIISGLARAVLAVEARDSSGVLNTVRWAADQGRDVLAVPGTITAETSSGTNDLIKDGARPITSLEDLLEALEVQLRPRERPEVSLNQDDQALLERLSEVPVHVDELAEASSRPMPILLSQLLELEMKGLVRQLPGMQFVRESGR